MPLPAQLRCEEGFSLVELLVVLVIIGILALLAIPRFMSVTTRAKMTEAKLQLKTVHTLQQAYYLEHDVYAASLADIGFEQETLVGAGGNARYEIALEKADEEGFSATATAVVDFDKDGVYNVWQVRADGRIHQQTPD